MEIMFLQKKAQVMNDLEQHTLLTIYLAFKRARLTPQHVGCSVFENKMYCDVS